MPKPSTCFDIDRATMLLPSKLRETVMDIDELLKTIDDLSEADLEALIDRALSVQARRGAPVLSVEETALLLTINQGVPVDLRDRYGVLLEKQDNSALTDVEYTELLDVSNQIEGIGVKRIEALAKLATIRQVPLLKLIDDLGIRGPGVC